MSESPFWNDDWMRLQRNYWEQWGEMSRKAMGMERPPKSPWENAMEHWWKAVSPAADRQTRHFMEKMLDQGKMFFRLGDEVSNNLNGASDWSDTLSKTFEKLQDQFATAAEQSSSVGKQGFEQIAGFWEGPIESWRKAAGQLPLNDELAGTPKLFEQLLGMPGLGYTREDEERYKGLAQAWLQYQHALARYNHFFADVGTKSLRCMQDEIRKLKEEGGKIDSGRALYDTWVGACEKVYAEHTMTPEYAKVHGELVNALMAFKKQWRELQDQRLGMLGMPTRRELQTLQCRLQESRRELRSMRCEVELLREQMGELRTPKPAEASAASSSRSSAKKVSKKKVARKKAASQ